MLKWKIINSAMGSAINSQYLSNKLLGKNSLPWEKLTRIQQTVSRANIPITAYQSSCSTKIKSRSIAHVHKIGFNKIV